MVNKSPGESNANAAKLVEIANRDQELVYIKHDGSLDDGLEIVTHPMSLDFHFNQMPWAEVLDKAKAMGYRSHLSEQTDRWGWRCPETPSWK